MKNLKTYIFSFIFCFFISALFCPGSAFARMEAVDDARLDTVSAGIGFSFFVKDITFSWSADKYAYTDTDTGSSVEFNNLTLHDGSGGPVFFDSGDEPLSFDIFTLSNPLSPLFGKTFFAVTVPQWNQLYHTSVDNLVFCDADLGRLDMGNINKPYSACFFSGHGDGLDFEIDFQRDIEETVYTYNDSGDSLSISGTFFSGSAAGAPESPADWNFDGSFTLGDINNGSPATLDVITLDSNGVTSAIINLPARGTMRIENVQLNGTGFGPCAIDGINVHRLSIMVKPGNL